MGKWIHRITNVDKKLQVGSCSQCGDNTPLRSRKHGTRWSCRNQDQRGAHGGDEKKAWIRHREDLVKRQGGLCAICLKLKLLVLDHDHNTGLKRSALCRTCNLGLGMFKEDISLLQAAISYLKKTRSSSG